nr:sugar transferase [Brevibacterium yomogidense]
MVGPAVEPAVGPATDGSPRTRGVRTRNPRAHSPHARNLHARRRTPLRLAVKRVLDVVGASIGLLVLSPLLLCVAITVRIRLGAPVLFTQWRTGRHGAAFTMLKFRTMTDAVGADGELLPDDQRLTACGRLLRRTSLDELPELLNVLRGDMSLVGPRPLLESYTEHFTEVEARRLLVRPGITGLAQVRGRNTVGWDDRLAWDVEYVDGLSVRRDLRLLLETVAAVLRSDGVVEDPSSVMEDFDVERARRS